MLSKKVVVFVDGILIYSTVSEKQLKLLEKVSTCLQKYVFYCKLKKHSFLKKTTTFLEFNINPEGMHISNLEVWSLYKWPVLTIVKYV